MKRIVCWFRGHVFGYTKRTGASTLIVYTRDCQRCGYKHPDWVPLDPELWTVSIDPPNDATDVTVL